MASGGMSRLIPKANDNKDKKRRVQRGRVGKAQLFCLKSAFVISQKGSRSTQQNNMAEKKDENTTVKVRGSLRQVL